jgi:hypothetical protein
MNDEAMNEIAPNTLPINMERFIELQECMGTFWLMEVVTAAIDEKSLQHS